MRKNNLIDLLKQVLKLYKIKVSITVLFSFITGYVAYSGNFSLQIALPVAGLFFLACGASALNQFQERNMDVLMNRTQNRPIPSGKISAQHGLIIALFTSIFGTFLLYFGGGFLAVSLGVFNLLWYNFVYTNLKKITAFAVVPGALTGAIPPIIGWVAAGGAANDLPIILIAFFLYIWQIPHFWLLLFKYDHEYKMAGFASLEAIFSNSQLKKISIVWVISTIFSALQLVYFSVLSSKSSVISLCLLSLIFFYFFIIGFSKTQDYPKKSFIWLNIYMVLILLIIILDKVF